MSEHTRPILLVEDNPDDFEATRRAFRKADLANPLQHAPSAEVALAYLRAPGRPRPSLILLDLNMPGMGGRGLLELLKRDEDFRDIPVVMLTGSASQEDIKACYALGANAYVLKSADFEILAAAIKSLKEYWLDTVTLPAIFDREEKAAPVFALAGPLPAAAAVHLSPDDVRRKIVGAGLAAAPPEGAGRLTARELEILTWIARGKSRWEAGVILGISEDTVKAHLDKVRQKLGAANTTHAIAIALLHRLLTP